MASEQGDDSQEKEAKQEPPVKDEPADQKMMEQSAVDRKTANKILTSQRMKKEQEEGMAKSGEGSRGGKIIGHTKTGKPVYDSAGHSAHSDFTPQEHKQAAKISEKMSDEADKKAGVMGSKEGEAHWDRADAHRKAANKMEMDKKKMPKAPDKEKFSQMSMGEHYKEAEKHHEMSKKHEEAGNKDKAEMHRKLYEAHDQAHGAHIHKETAVRNDRKYGEHAGKDFHSLSSESMKDAHVALDEAHAMSKKDMKKSLDEHLANVEQLLK